MKAAREKANPPLTVLVSQAVAGQEGTVFYVTTLQSSLAGFDAIPPIQQTLGDEGYAKFLKTNAEAVSGTETVINRFLPDLSKRTRGSGCDRARFLEAEIHGSGECQDRRENIHGECCGYWQAGRQRKETLVGTPLISEGA